MSEFTFFQGEDWAISAAGSGFSLAVRGRTVLRNDGCVVNGFAEKTALAGKIRPHETVDTLSGELDLSAVIPFGGEPRVQRSLHIFDGAARVIVDIAGGAAAVESLTVDTLELPGPWTRWAVQELPTDGGEVAAGAQWRELPEAAETLWQGPQPMLRLLVEDAQGLRLEIGLGDDLWRWCGAGDIGEAAYEIYGGQGCVMVKRQVFAMTATEEKPAPKRPWRFNWYFAWSQAASAMAEKLENGWIPAPGTLPATAGCLGRDGKRTAQWCIGTAPARKALRTELRRKTGGEVGFLGSFAACWDPAHCQRPQKAELLHWNMDEMLELYLWANRQLGKQDGHFHWITAPGEWPSGMVLNRILSGHTRLAGE